MTGQSRFRRRRRLSLPLLAGLVLLHVAALYGLARALAPDLTASVEQQVVSAFTVTITTPPAPPPPENQPEPDECAQSLALTVALGSGEAQDLSGVGIEGDVVEFLAAQPTHTQDRRRPFGRQFGRVFAFRS